jgi:N-acetylglutamate synthase-like GNAT family acetyltransferase
MNKINYSIVPCTENYFEQVIKGIEIMQLDNRELKMNDFLIALVESSILAGFGRIRKYTNVAEVCSVGVFEKYRNNGIGKSIIQQLIYNFTIIQKNTLPIYVVTIIPKYFEKLGFEIVKEASYPKEIYDKWLYCVSELPVPEEYVIMRFNHLSPNL